MTASTNEQGSGSKVSTAPFSATKANGVVLILSAKPMQSLINSGLIAGITPTLIRRGLRQGILAGVFSALDGSNVE